MGDEKVQWIWYENTRGFWPLISSPPAAVDIHDSPYYTPPKTENFKIIMVPCVISISLFIYVVVSVALTPMPRPHIPYTEASGGGGG